jgi:hypothetical protein
MKDIKKGEDMFAKRMKKKEELFLLPYISFTFAAK